MHEEKNIDTVIQFIYRWRGTGQVELFRVVVQFHWFGVDRDWKATGSQDQRWLFRGVYCWRAWRRVVTNDSETINRRCELVVLHSAVQFPGMTELDVVDEDDTVDDFVELDAGAAASITIVCNVLSQGRFLFSTGWCKSCAFFTLWCISQELDVSSATFSRLARRKEGCRFIVAKVRVQTVISSEWSSAAVMFPSVATVSSSMRSQSWKLIQSRTSTVNSQSARSEQMMISQDEVCQWTPTTADTWKDQERSLPSWQRCQQQLPETVILCDIKSPMHISTCRRSVQHVMLYNRR